MGLRARWTPIAVPLAPVFRPDSAITVRTGIRRDLGQVHFWTPSAVRSFHQPVGAPVAREWSGVYHMALVERRERGG